MRLPPARATFALAGATALSWAVAASAGLTGQVAKVAGYVPARLTAGFVVPDAVPALFTPLSATLVHANLFHLAFNLLMLGFCGRFVEAAIGPIALVSLYVVGAFAAAGGQTLLDPGSLAPMIGASGAISAVVGAYALLFGHSKAPARLGPRLGLAIHVTWLAAAWVGLQLLISVSSSTLPGMTSGSTIAVGAHVGGFVIGLILARPLLQFHFRHA